MIAFLHASILSNLLLIENLWKSSNYKVFITVLSSRFYWLLGFTNKTSYVYSVGSGSPYGVYKVIATYKSYSGVLSPAATYVLKQPATETPSPTATPTPTTPPETDDPKE